MRLSGKERVGLDAMGRVKRWVPTGGGGGSRQVWGYRSGSRFRETAAALPDGAERDRI